MRPFYDTTNDDIDNEVKAITKLCAEGVHENIVAVLQHGWLKRSPYYFIDMELCDLNLENFIYAKSLDGFESEFESEGKTQQEVRLANLWPITTDIVRGLRFIHVNGHVHRDMKPRNGIFSNAVVLISCDSTLFPLQSTLEDHRFWTYIRRNVQGSEYNSIFERHVGIPCAGTAQRGG